MLTTLRWFCDLRPEVGRPLAEDLAVEAVPEDDVLGLVGDLGGEEDLRLVVRRREREREQLDGDPLLAEEELREAELEERRSSSVNMSGSAHWRASSSK